MQLGCGPARTFDTFSLPHLRGRLPYNTRLIKRQHVSHTRGNRNVEVARNGTVALEAKLDES